MPQFKTSAVKINYRLEGPLDGPVVMLAHSLGADLSMWDPQVAELTGAGFRVLRYDHRGHGQSSLPFGEYTLSQLAGDAIDLLDGLGIAKVHFCGLSMGGMVGQELGARHAGRLSSLVLCSSAAHMPQREVWEERMHTVRARGMAAVVDATIERWFTAEGRKRLPQEVQKIRQILLKTSVEGFCACCAAIRDMDQREAIRRITACTLILVGEHDPGTPVSSARFLHERIPHSRLIVMADAAHLQNVEQAQRFTKELVQFLTEIK